jgi:drug/metabolite transporter (DMT)-like permease
VTRPSLEKGSGLLVVLALAAVYFIWGSTYLALRFGLEGFPPFLLGGIRFIIAGSLMYTVLRLRGTPSPTRRQWWNAGRMGVLLLVGGVGSMTVAESVGVGSGVAASAAAAIPVWAALVAGSFGQWPARREWIGLVIGLVGVIVLLQEGDFQANKLGAVLVIVGPVLWAFGSVWGSRQEMPDGFMAPASQLLVAGVVMLIGAAIRGERITETPNATSWLALAYLILIGSMVAYTAYFYLLKTVRPALATSYAYVNPLVAIVLGLTLGAEIITGPVLIALPLILAGVGLVATARRNSAAARPRPLRSARAPLEEAA